jgi:uncharacterized protein (DUF2235 family)
MPKRLALFLDGTWNTVNDNTNVWRIKSICADDGVTQLTYYDPGLGTAFGQKFTGGIWGLGINDNVIDAYKWLVEHYDEADEIFIFGFSRGAYTARSLSGLIGKCGLLKLGAPLSIRQLYDRYKRGAITTIRTLIEQRAGGANGLLQGRRMDIAILPRHRNQICRRVGYGGLGRGCC